MRTWVSADNAGALFARRNTVPQELLKNRTLPNIRFALFKFRICSGRRLILRDLLSRVIERSHSIVGLFLRNYFLGSSLIALSQDLPVRYGKLREGPHD
ncbi:hypothetical protein D9M68_325990 [compost metagenome]